MSEIVYVSPQLYLVADSEWKSDVAKRGYIPMLKADLQTFEKMLHNTSRLQSAHIKGPIDNSVHIKTNGSAGSLLAKGSGANGGLFGENKMTSKYVPLKQFLPISLEQQLHTISLHKVPFNESNGNVESFIAGILQIALEANSQFFCSIKCWTNITSPGIDTQDLFVRLDSGNDLGKYSNFVCFLKALVTKVGLLELHLDSNTTNFVKDHITQETKSDDIPDEAVKAFKGLIEKLKVANLDGNKEHDNNVETEYKVDLRTLSDIPTDSLDQLCKDIKEFRTKVVSIEREKMTKEHFEESKRMKQHMMKMFEQIKKSNKDQLGVDVEENVPDDDDVDDVGDDGGDDDDVLEKQRLDQERASSNARYKEYLSTLASVIEPRIQKLKTDTLLTKQYEGRLTENRALALKELEHTSNDFYYDHHRSFKDEEEYLDSLNRAKFGDVTVVAAQPKTINEENVTSSQSSKETESNLEEPETAGKESLVEDEHMNIKIAFKRAIDKPNDTEPNEAIKQMTRDENTTETIPLSSKIDDIIPYSGADLEQRLAKLKESRVVDELVNEYLGVYEDELVEYIFDNIRENKSKEVLFEDLKETFDEDAIKIVDTIWKREEFH
ncbi:Snu71p KNAG_0B05470 [Huiozyma naganishii CBS 8797]|uniref:U1 small nuclear ribonucleoprotein component SNU71 n=1 Tax=Huiozyma naganishii (strain ATCC MYA-139 / BCRC 22969 / CBS 8797 / KCTC 17520 / NBRC 10181 / NCYC 3082 / Yp74L-3) TaxID=1071383 RepID=J7R2F2_HUIN7|nr:hypothetical protein KNAG_0B05470 [Kazachstania naganishii CBS 8797]CCK68980.1 hypothetical protein KNAG_0B05470 [Kazachstania naganishii CBS 8797]